MKQSLTGHLRYMYLIDLAYSTCLGTLDPYTMMDRSTVNRMIDSQTRQRKTATTYSERPTVGSPTVCEVP